MPLYDYGCKNKDCKHIWEVFHKLAESGPSECPECGHEEVGRLISPVFGSVELTGHDLTAKIKADARKLNKQAESNQKLAANLIGEDKYNSSVSAVDKARRDLKGS